MRNASVLILTDETEFARLLTACWQAERQAPGITVLSSDLWKDHEAVPHDLVVVGPVLRRQTSRHLAVLGACHRRDSLRAGGFARIRPIAVAVPSSRSHSAAGRLDANAAACCRRISAPRRSAAALQASRESSAKNEHQATLGRYMMDMKHSVNNALTSMLGNAELLLLEPGQLSSQSLAQIKTIHSMALRINEIMQRFSSLASEMREAENASQAETEAVPARPATRR